MRDYLGFIEEIQGLVNELTGETPEKTGSSQGVICNLKKIAKSSSPDKEAESAKIEAGLQELLDNLRIYIKYDIYDLEATRRENEFLKRLLNGKKGQQ